MKQTREYVVLGLITLISSAFIFSPGMPSLHDFIHGARIAEMHQILSEGQWPPRWSQHFGFGYGMPLFQFYAPLPWMIGALIYALTGSLLFSVKSLFVLASLINVIGAYLLAKELLEHYWVQWLLVFSLTLVPYRAVNLAVRGAVAEAWGLAFLVWILAGLFRYWRSPDKPWVLIGGSIGLTLSHNLSVLLGMPLGIGVVLLLIVVDRSNGVQWSSIRSRLFRVLGVGLIAGMSTLFYVLPSFFENRYTQIQDRILTGYFDYRVHFLYIRQLFSENWQYGGSGWGPADTMSFFLGWPAILSAGTAIVGGGYLLLRRRSLQDLVKPLLFGVLGLGLAFLSILKSASVWGVITLLPYLQFPWRWVGVASVALTLAGMCVIDLFGRSARIVSLVIIGVVCAYSLNYFLAPLEPGTQTDLYYSDPERIATHMSGVLPDYLPTDAKPENLSIPPSMLLYCGSDCTSETLLNQAHQKLFQVTNPSPSLTTLQLFDFPGWQVYLDGEPTEHTTTANGLIQLEAPSGTSLIGARYEKTPLRHAADGLSASALIILLILWLKPSLLLRMARHD